jgi:hypothetical protein
MSLRLNPFVNIGAANPPVAKCDSWLDKAEISN